MKGILSWWYTGIIVVIFILTIALRLYHFTYPVADWHSFRQVDTAAVARYFIQFGTNPLKPRYEDLSNIQSGKDNPMGWRMVEFPLYQVIAVELRHLSARLTLEMWLRVTSILAAAGTSVLLILFAAELWGPVVGLLTGLVYAILPYSMYYGRVILPEPLAVFLSMAALYTLVKLPDAGGKSRPAHNLLFFTSIICSALAILVKPTAGFILIPIPYLLYKKYSISKAFIFRALLYGVISLVPFLLWRKWILQFPEGIPASEWLLNNGNIRFKGAWFYWLFSQRLGSLMLGYWGLIPFGIGLILPVGKREGWTIRWLLFGSLSYLIVFAAGNVQHDYYQILLLPIVSLLLAKGLYYLIRAKNFSRMFAIGTAIASLSFTVAFSWYTIRTYYWINHPEIIEAGQEADKILPKDAKVIAPYNGDTTFLYQTNRQGWPEGFDIDKKIAMGATAYVTVSPTDNDFETRDLAKKYTVLVRNSTYAIIDLTKPNTTLSKTK